MEKRLVRTPRSRSRYLVGQGGAEARQTGMRGLPQCFSNRRLGLVAAVRMIGQRRKRPNDPSESRGVLRPVESASVAILLPRNRVPAPSFAGAPAKDGARWIGAQDHPNLPACRHCPERDIGHPLEMVSESSSDGSRQAMDGGATPDKSSESSGLSQLLSKVLEQLNISAWLPAAMLVGNLALLLQLHSNHKFDITRALKDLTEKPLGTLIVLVFSLLLATIVTQAFEFEIIRLLEGYVSSTHGVIQSVTALRIRRHERKRSGLEDKRRKSERAAFMQAREVMLSLPGAYERAVLDFIEDDVYQRPQKRVPTPAVARMIDETDWRKHLPSDVLYQMDCIDSRLDSYPESNRLLPTRLGNVLRAAEDKLPLGDDEDLEGFVIRRYDEIPSSLKDEHKDYRTRLDMYCSLVLVFAALSSLALALLISVAPAWGTGLFVGAYAVMACVCYEAAIASARGYGEALQEIGRKLTA